LQACGGSLASESSSEPAFNPYVGPRTFVEAQRRLFFGRDREARDLTARIVAERLLLFYAQSGAGKSSLLNARVIGAAREKVPGAAGGTRFRRPSQGRQVANILST
jgi:hypothetical protein